MYLWVRYTIHSTFVFIEIFQNERERGDLSMSLSILVFSLKR